MPSRRKSNAQETTTSASYPAGPFLVTVTLTLQVSGPFGKEVTVRDVLTGGGTGQGSKGGSFTLRGGTPVKGS